MRLELRLAFCLLFSAIGWVTPASAQTINIYAGNDRGGLGDIAQNIWMARRILRALPPSVTINLIIPAEIGEKLKTLLPGFSASARRPQYLDRRIKLLPLSGAGPPPADFVLGFSLDLPGMLPDSVRKSAPVALSFTEFHSGYGLSLRHSLASYADASAGKQTIELHTQTGPENAGLMLSESRPPRPDRRAAIDKIARLYPGSGASNLRKGARLGFAYSSRPQATALYVKAMAKAASGSMRGQQIVLVVKDFPELDAVRLPPNLKLIRVQGLPLSLSEALIANSDLAVLVTGDLSLNMALEHGKPCFYESNVWKKLMAAEISSGLAKASPELAASGWPQVFEIDILHPSADADDLLKVIERPEIQAAFEKAVEQNRSRWSLTKTVRNYLDAFEAGIDLRWVTTTGWKEVLRLLEHGTSRDALYSTLKAELSQAHPSGRWREVLFSLLMFKHSLADAQLMETVQGEIRRGGETGEILSNIMRDRGKADPAAGAPRGRLGCVLESLGI